MKEVIVHLTDEQYEAIEAIAKKEGYAADTYIAYLVVEEIAAS